MSTVKLTGFRELEQALGQFKPSTAKGISGRALKKAAAPIKAAAIAKAPRTTGALADSIDVRIRTNLRRRDMVMAVIGPVFKGDYRTLANPAMYVKGIKNGTERTYAYGSAPGVYGWFVEHGTYGKPGRPFLRPAFDENKYRAVEDIKDVAWEEIRKAAARAAKKAAKG
jgi:HK97 gp10 family phage protein